MGFQSALKQISVHAAAVHMRDEGDGYTQGNKPGSRFPRSPVCKATESIFPRQGGAIEKVHISLKPLPSQAFLHGDRQQFSLVTVTWWFCALQHVSVGNLPRIRPAWQPAAARCSPGSASARWDDARAVSQTVVSHQYFQAAFSCKQGKIKNHHLLFGIPLHSLWADNGFL